MEFFTKKHRGFTLIELLVVIAIIGILASIVLVSLGGARAKARDAQRVSDVKQMALILEMEESTSHAQALTGCTDWTASTTQCGGPVEVGVQFPNFIDPSGGAGPCTDASGDTCHYSIGKESGATGATTDDYQICFYLESGAGTVAAGLNRITTGSQLASGCDTTP